MTAASDKTLLEALERAGLTTVEGAFAYAGGADLDKPGLGHRRRSLIEIVDSAGKPHRLYLKRYQREPLAARLRRRWTYGSGRSIAAVEFDNILAVRAAGIATMEAVCFGQQAHRRDFGRSFIIVTAVPGEALERCAEEILSANKQAGEELAQVLGKLLRTFHAAGFVHRDLYTSHVFIDRSAGRFAPYLIDLARVFRPRWRTFRWQVKDLAQLKSSMPEEWCRLRWRQFMAAYFGNDDQRRTSRYNRAVERKATAILRRELRVKGT